MTGSEILKDSEKKEIEKLISESYGGLDNQSNLMLFPNSLSTTTISFDFGKLQLFEQLKMEVMQLCDHFNIPYDILPLSGQSTFNNQDNAYTMLYVTAERWVMMIQDAFKSLGVEFEFELKGKPNTEAQKLEQAKKDAVATMAQAVSSGLMTIEEARKELEKYYDISKEKAL
jgi:phage portal protein BeeE